MKRTEKEIIELIKQKRESARNDLVRRIKVYLEDKCPTLKTTENYMLDKLELQIQIDTYTDVLSLWGEE